MRVLKLTSLIVNKGVLLSQVGMVFLAVVPAFLEIAVPLAALLGPILTFARLSGDSEVIVIRASGVSLFQLIRPVLIFGVFVTLLALGVSHVLKPWGFKTLSNTLFEIARTKSTAGLEAGVFNDLGQIILYGEEIDSKSGEMKNVLIDERTPNGSSRVILAQEGTIQPDPENRAINFNLRNGEIHEESEGKYILTRYVSNQIVLDPSKLDGSEGVQKERRVRELYWSELRQEKREIRELLNTPPSLNGTPHSDQQPDEETTLEPPTTEELSSQAAPPPTEEAPTQEELESRLRRIVFEMHTRFSLPFATILLALVGMPLGIQSPRSQRTWGVGLSALIGLIAFLSYFALYSITRSMAEDGLIPLIIGAWAPGIIIAGVAFLFLKQMSTEQWQTISDGLSTMLQGMKSFLNPRRYKFVSNLLLNR